MFAVLFLVLNHCRNYTLVERALGQGIGQISLELDEKTSISFLTLF